MVKINILFIVKVLVDEEEYIINLLFIILLI